MLTASFKRDYISRFLPALPPAELSDYPSVCINQKRTVSIS